MKTLILKSIDLLNLFPLFNRYTSNTATVFMLHSVGTSGQEGGCDVPVNRLREFLIYLRDSSYNVISLSDYIEAIRNRQSLYKTVVFTVDDGYRNFYQNCFPLFREFDFPAAIFLTTDFVDKQVFLWWDKLEFAIEATSHEHLNLADEGLGTFALTGKGLKKQAITEITERCKSLPDETRQVLVDKIVKILEVDISNQPSGKYEPLHWSEIVEMSQHKIGFYPHTKTHPIMSRLSYDRKLSEITDSKRILEEKLNRSLDIFSYPNGKTDDIDADTIKALRHSGISVALTSIPGFNNTKTSNNLLMLHRFAIPKNMLWFKQYVSGLEFAKGRLRKLESIKPY